MEMIQKLVTAVEGANLEIKWWKIKTIEGERANDFGSWPFLEHYL